VAFRLFINGNGNTTVPEAVVKSKIGCSSMVMQTENNTKQDVSPLIRDIMTHGVVTAPEELSVTEVVAIMNKAQVGAVVVAKDDGSVSGIFTERDLLTKMNDSGFDPKRTKVSEVMTVRPETIDADARLSVLWPQINEWGFRHIPVVSNGEPVGMLSLRDVFRLRLWNMETQLDQEIRSLQQLRSLIHLDKDERAKELLRINERLSQLALTDDLTGLYNHRYLMRRLQEEVSRAQRSQTFLSLLFVDIDRFKRVNDVHGHAAGDQVLRGFANILRNTVEGGSVLGRIRRHDVVARYGGEEFALLLPMTDTDAAMVVAERVRAAVESTPIPYSDDDQVTVTVSVGVATLPIHGSNEEGLLAAADEALLTGRPG
jgi:diguanylate cyclase (GGDEF)-like protein